MFCCFLGVLFCPLTTSRSDVSVNNMYFSRIFLLQCRSDEFMLSLPEAVFLLSPQRSCFPSLLFYSTAGIYMCHVAKLLRKLQQVKINKSVNASLLQSNSPHGCLNIHACSKAIGNEEQDQQTRRRLEQHNFKSK